MTDSSRSQPSPAMLANPTRKTAVAQPERMNGAQAIVRSLEELGTDVVFGLPGGAVLPLYEASTILLGLTIFWCVMSRGWPCCHGIRPSHWSGRSVHRYFWPGRPTW